MRVALLQPTYWPEVRRGSERLTHDLGSELARRGHEVTLLTSHRRPPAVAHEDGMEVVRGWRPPERVPLSWYELHVARIPEIWWRLRRGRFDIVHASFATDAWAALRVRDSGGPPVVFSYHGIPNREYLVKRRYRLEMVADVVGRADAVTVLSEPAAAALARWFGRVPDVLPGGVRPEDFAGEAARSRQPTILCAASLGDPRKRADLLFDAFARLRQRRPDARLLLVRVPDPVMSASPPAVPEGAEWIDADGSAELARLYGEAWISVLPAVDEAFGLVLIESLAAGTPVVAADSGALPMLLDRPKLGALFQQDDPKSLASALDEALDLAADPTVASACRARAADFDWRAIAASYEDLYVRILDESRPRSGERPRQ